MGERAYRYHTRPRSPTFYSPARASLPSGLGHSSHYPEQHMHVVPSGRREIVPGPRSSGTLITAGPVTTTTYKVEPVRSSSRARGATLESYKRPVVPSIVTATPRDQHRPVIHSGGRAHSPLNDPYRSSQEEIYTAVPASSRHHHHGHQKRYSATMDNADMNRLHRERERSRLRVEPKGGKEVVYSGSRSRPVYSGALVAQRHPDTVADDYGHDGYGYTNPRDLVQYDLSNNVAPPSRSHKRRESFGESRRERPVSGNYNDFVARPYETRERGPPPSVRGFDRIPARAPHEWDQQQSYLSVDPVRRPASVQPYDNPRERSRDPDGHRRSSSRQPGNVYHDREPKRSQREDYSEARDEDLRRRNEKPRSEPRSEPRLEQRSERYDDNVEQRGYGIRPEKPERIDRHEKRDNDKKEKKESMSGAGGALATGLSIAGAALGVKAFKDATDSKDDDRDEPRRRRDYDDEPRRRRDPRDEREPVDLSRDTPPPIERDTPPRERERERERDPPTPRERRKSNNPQDRPDDLVDRDRDRERERDREWEPRERRDPRDDRDEIERHRPHRNDGPTFKEAAIEDSASDESKPRRRRKESGAKFNPKDTMDLMALKAALNSSETASPTTQHPEIVREPDRTPRQSISKSSRELVDVRDSLKNDDSRALRIVTPPPANADKPLVKSILRQPREKFPEDPTPIREGVAPLKDAKKDGVPPDARWTKISRKLVNPEALEAGKERYEAREDFVIVLRVLSRDEVQGYAEVTETIRAAREEVEEAEERDARRRARRERHDRHKRERIERDDPSHKKSDRSSRRRGGSSESDTTEDEHERRPKMLEPAHPVMSGGLGLPSSVVSNAGSSEVRR